MLSLLLLSQLAFAAGNPYEGCKDNYVQKANFRNADVSKELLESQRRVERICGKELPGRLKNAQSLANRCAAGNPGTDAGAKALDKMQGEVQELTDNVKNACQVMQENLKTAQGYCNSRAAHVQSLRQRVQPELPTEPTAQHKALQRQAMTYHAARNTYIDLSREAEASAKKIYQTLPDKDEKRGEKESADTKDPKLDALVARLRTRFQGMQQQMRQPQAKAACGKLAAARGDLTAVASVLKNNLWPNGKKSARALSALASLDNMKSEEYGNLSNLTSVRANNLMEDVIRPAQTPAPSAAPATTPAPPPRPTTRLGEPTPGAGGGSASQRGAAGASTDGLEGGAPSAVAE